MEEKNVTKERAIVVLLFFVSIAVLGAGIYILVQGIEQAETLYMMLGAVLCLISLYALPSYLKKLHFQRLCNKVERAIEQDGMREIRDIAKKAKASEKSVLKAFKYLKDNGYLKACYINFGRVTFYEDEIKRERELKETARKVRDAELKEQKERNEFEAQKLAQEKENFEKRKKSKYHAKCKSCGANVALGVDETSCPYCGSPIERK